MWLLCELRPKLNLYPLRMYADGCWWVLGSGRGEGVSVDEMQTQTEQGVEDLQRVKTLILVGCGLRGGGGKGERVVLRSREKTKM